MDTAVFWSWFVGKEAELRDVSEHGEDVLDELYDKLNEVAEGLGFEIGGSPDGPLELIITAEGDEDLFPAVYCLAESAPDIDGWEIVALKPPRGFDFIATYGDRSVDPDDVWFLEIESEERPGELGIRVALEGDTEGDVDDLMTCLLGVMEAGIGEISLACDVGHLEYTEPPEDPVAEGWKPLRELPEVIESWKQRHPSVTGS
ncbi:MAG: hypothetical protein RL885_29460 [Planctomycetota bacterium]